MERDTKIVSAILPALDRATVQPYADAVPGQFYYQRFAHPVGVEAERLLGELEGGHALLFPSGSGATTALTLALLEPGAKVAIARGGYWGTVGLLGGELGTLGSLRSSCSTRPASRRWPIWSGSSRARIRC